LNCHATNATETEPGLSAHELGSNYWLTDNCPTRLLENYGGDATHPGTNVRSRLSNLRWIVDQQSLDLGGARANGT
jgi:hypothetical protein